MTESGGSTTPLQERFLRDGFVSLPGFLDPEELAALNELTQRLLAERLSALPREHVYYEDKNDPATLKQIQQLHEHDAGFHRLMFNSPFERLAATLLDEPVVGRNIQYFNKPSGQGKPTPPHQDGFYFMLQPNHAVTMWLALEDIDEEQGCVHYVCGSHARGLRPHAPSGVLGFSQQITDFGLPDDLANTVSCPGRAGHLLVHHALTVHWAGGNRSSHRSRQALGLIYYGASAREDRNAHAAYQKQLAASLATRKLI